IDAQRLILDAVDDRDLEPAGKALLARGARVAEPRRVGAERLDLPDFTVEPLPRPAMERVRAFIGFELDDAAVERKARAGDAPGIAAHQRAEAVAFVARLV